MIQHAVSLLLAAFAYAAHDGEPSRPEASPRTGTLTGTVMLGDLDESADAFGIFIRSLTSGEIEVIRGEGGRFNAAVSPGRYEIAVVAPGYDILCRTITVSEGDRNTLRVVRLKPGTGQLSVALRDDRGDPQSGHRVHLARAFAPGREVSSCESPVELRTLADAKMDDVVTTVITDDNGSAMFLGVPSGPIALVVEPPSGLPWPPRVMVLTEAEERSVRIDQTTVSLAIRLTDGDGRVKLPDLIKVERPIDGFQMHMTCAANYCCDELRAMPLECIGPVPFPRLSRYYHIWVPGPGGDDDVVLLQGLQPGSWRLTVEAGGQSVAVEAVALADAITQVDLHLGEPERQGALQPVVGLDSPGRQGPVTTPSDR